MRFVHSLVRTYENDKSGWCAPVELGEDSPHYVSFVVPLDDEKRLSSEYECELFETHQDRQTIESRHLIKKGLDSFVLELAESVLWFVLRPCPQDVLRLPYVGKLKHDDFTQLFIEIQPEDPDALDVLFEQKGIVVVGCEPFTHYRGIQKLQTTRKYRQRPLQSSSAPDP
jgi:hypothetical protein